MSIIVEMIGLDKFRFTNSETKETRIENAETYEMMERIYKDEIFFVPRAYRRFLEDQAVGWVEYTSDKWEQVKECIPSKIADNAFEYQKETIVKMIWKKRCLNAFEMGLGKTMVSIACLSWWSKHTDGLLVVICPSALKLNWVNELSTWWPEIEAIDLHSWKSIGTLISSKVYVVSFEIASKVEFDNIACVIVDESHNIKNRQSIRYKKIGPCLRKACSLYLLSGTPKPNRPKELFTQLNCINPDLFCDYFTFADRYCGGHKNIFDKYVDNGTSHVNELAFLLSKVIIRKRREDVSGCLPEYQRLTLMIEPDKSIKEFKEYTDKLVQYTSIIDHLSNTGNCDDPDRSKRQRLFDPSFELNKTIADLYRLTSIVKTKSIVELIHDRAESFPDEKVIVFFKHIPLMQQVASKLKEENRIVIDGSVANKDRMTMIERFLDPHSECFIALLTLGTCATGLNLVPVSHMIFAGKLISFKMLKMFRH